MMDNADTALDTRNAPLEFAQRRATLEHRLEEGYRRIDEAALTGVDVTEWEQFWIRLLREYEGVCRELDRAA